MKLKKKSDDIIEKLKHLLELECPAGSGRLQTFADTHSHSHTVAHMNNFIYSSVVFLLSSPVSPPLMP